MDFDEYRRRGKEMVNYIADYLENIRSRRVFPDVKPGYMKKLVPGCAPMDGENWDTIFHDIERVIMPGVTHWQSPYMHAYFPALNSCPSLLGDMLADAINCLGFTWASSPACTELETIVMDWLGKMIGLPSDFLHSNEQTMGGGVIQTTASEATFVALLAARTEALRKCKANDPDLQDAEINGRLVGYCSEQAHSSVEKAGLMGLVKMRLLPCDGNLSLRGDTLRESIKRDRDRGLIPFYVCATLGTTGACAFDNLKELGPICEEEDIWMHIDAAYAGTAFICPEFRFLMAGVEYASSFAFNPSKWMMVHFDCTAMWLKNSGALHRTFNVQPLYLRHENTGAAIDYMHWQIPLSKRFRALKLWFVIRSFGVKGLQEHVRKGVKLATQFEKLVLSDGRFEVPAERHLGMVVFRLKGDNNHTETLLKRINKCGQLHAVPASFKGKYVIRFTVTSQHTTPFDIERDWSIIKDIASDVLDEEELDVGPDEVFVKVCEDVEEDEGICANEQKSMSIMGRIRREGMKRHDFGMSLILSNVPMSPKFINGSFAALFEDNNDIIGQYVKTLRRRSMDYTNQPLRLSPRKKLRDHGKQYSLDITVPRPNLASRTLAPKQGSLDSKIEEIFENSIENETQEQTTGASAKEMPSFVTMNNNFTSNTKCDDLEIPVVTEALVDDVYQTTNGSNKIVCTHCGNIMQVDR